MKNKSATFYMEQKRREQENKVLDFKLGESYRAVVMGRNEIYKIHIDAIIPSANGDGNMIVYRYFWKHKRYWHYDIKEDWWLTSDIELAKEKECNKNTNSEQN